MKSCACGCDTPIHSKDKWGRNVSYVRGHSNKGRYGSESPCWRGGRSLDSRGYWNIRVEGHPRATRLGSYVKEHIVIMEKHLGRFMDPREVIHHKNGIVTDNRIENLQLVNPADHNRIHKKGKTWKWKRNAS
jgi:hypothetical protein